MAKWICSQIGAREHFAIPRALNKTGQLAHLYTDFWAGSFLRSTASITKPLHSLAARHHPDLTGGPVSAWNCRSLVWEARLRYQARRNHNPYSAFLDIGRRFANSVRDALRHRADLNERTILFAYDTGALEAFEWCRDKGIRCILNQMDPNRMEVDLVRQEELRWPGWQNHLVTVPETYFRRREHEWALADKIIVNSEFSRNALIQQGVHPAKLVVIPLCYEPEGTEISGSQHFTFPAFSPSRPFRVLFLGQVILRKGIQYLIEAAKLLKSEHIQFDVVGPIGISEAAVRSAPPSVAFHGRATRNQAAIWYRQSDLFLLPTLSDGFALTQLEAMSYGVPVIATPNCGRVVTNGIDGFIVPPRNPQALANALTHYLQDPALLESQREAALKRSRQFTIDHLAANLLKLEADLLAN